ncbi:MAG: proteasome-type protease [Maricaulaceae bacterium]
MTYCVALYLEEGLVFLSDTRTNAGVDHIATFPKSFVVEKPGERALVLMTAGNLATTQAVVNEVIEGRGAGANGETTLANVESMVGAAELVGAAVRRVHQRDGQSLRASDIRFDATLILGGQIKGRPMRLFQIYPEGNFIEASVETPFLQVGEHKYGKPILDRALTHETSIAHGVKLALVSMDSTLRSNLTVGLPIDLTTYHRDSLKIGLRRRIAEDDEYFAMLRNRWSDSLRGALEASPDPDWPT